MSFMSPKVPKIEKTPVPQMPVQPSPGSTVATIKAANGFTSLVNTTPEGLKRKPSVAKPTLLGGM